MVKIKNMHKFVGTLQLETGLHIGGSKDSLHIGGVDTPVIKFNKNGKETPYIPGSSLKGKLRSLLDSSISTADKNIINQLFGGSADGNSEKGVIPSTVLIRDSFLEDDNLSKNVLYEIKGENTIDKKTSKAKPRFIERLNPGLKFDVEIILREYEGVDYKLMKTYLIKALEMLEKDYLGGSGSRGYGKVNVSDIIIKLKNDEEIKDE